MAALTRSLWLNVKRSSSIICRNRKSQSLNATESCIQQPSSVAYVSCHTKYTDARMLRDVNRRKVIKEYAPLRIQINALRKNDILPTLLKEVADEEIAALPRYSCLTHSHKRCIVTSRARGLLKDWRMSRIIWRHLADYNQLSGVERAMWG